MFKLATMFELVLFLLLLPINAFAFSSENNNKLNDGRHYLDYKSEDVCKRLRVFAQSGTIKSYVHRAQTFIGLEYGRNVTLYCFTEDVTRVKISIDGNDVEGERLNSSSIQFNLEKPNIGSHTFNCTDDVNNCKNTMIIMITVTMSVSSPNIKHSVQAGVRHYFVQLGDDYEVICSSNENETLSIRYMNMARLKTVVKNSTTIVYKGKANKIEEETNYICLGNEAVKIQMIRITVDNPPAAFDLKCIAYHTTKLECTWSSSSANNKFKLFYVDEYERETLLCIDPPGKMSRICPFDNWVWGQERPLIVTKYFTLRLQACNNIFCDSQTFTIDQDSITKLKPPTDLRPLNKTSNWAVIGWRNPVFDSLKPTFKLELRILTMDWQELNSSVICHRRKCKSELSLLCPNTPYEVRVYARARHATEDRFWSEPISTVLITEAVKLDRVNSPCVDIGLAEPESITSSVDASREIGKLLRHIMRKKAAIIKMTNGLKQKMYKIESLRRSLIEPLRSESGKA